MTAHSAPEYSEADLALFARFREQRALCRPLACNGGALCWVERGPPAIHRYGTCRGCNRQPLALPIAHDGHTAYQRRFR